MFTRFYAHTPKILLLWAQNRTKVLMARQASGLGATLSFVTVQSRIFDINNTSERWRDRLRTYGILAAKKRHATIANKTVHTGLQRRVWVATDQTNHPRYPGCLTKLYTILATIFRDWYKYTSMCTNNKQPWSYHSCERDYDLQTWSEFEAWMTYKKTPMWCHKDTKPV